MAAREIRRRALDERSTNDTVTAEPAATKDPVATERRSRHQAKTKAPSDTASRLWAQSVQEHDSVRASFFAYEIDPTQYFFRPLLSDHSHPAVQAFYDALAAADALRVDDHTPTDLDFVQRYADRVAVAKRTWSAADKLARETGDTAFTDRQRKLMRTAQGLVSLALDDSAPLNERSTAYERVVALFADAELTPAPSITSALQQQLETAQRPQLP